MIPEKASVILCISVREWSLMFVFLASSGAVACGRIVDAMDEAMVTGDTLTMDL